MNWKWIATHGLPTAHDPKMQELKGFLVQKLMTASQYKMAYAAEWNVMADLLNSDINKRLKAPVAYAILANNTLFKAFEDLTSQMNLTKLPIDIKALHGENQDIITVYEQLIKAEDDRLGGGELRKKMYRAAHQKQIAWLYMHVDNKRVYKGYGNSWKNQIKAQIIDASQINFDPNCSQEDLSDCEFLVVEEVVSYNTLVAKFGKAVLAANEITAGIDQGDLVLNNTDPKHLSSERTNQKQLSTCFFRVGNENASYDYYKLIIINQNKVLFAPVKLKPNRFPLIPYTKFKIFANNLIGTNELYLTKNDYITKVKVESAIATNLIYESGQQKIINAQNVDAEAAKNLLYNPMAIVPVTGTNDVRNQIVPLEKKELPQGAFSFANFVDANTEKIVGNHGIAAGETNSLQTGQALSNAITQANLRQQAKTEPLKRFFIHYTNMLIDFMMEYYYLPMVHIIPKVDASPDLMAMTPANMTESSPEESSADQNRKAVLKHYHIKFEEDRHHIYVIAQMSRFKKLRKIVDINAETFSRMNEGEIQRATEAVYALDSQNPQEQRIMSKEDFIRLNPAFKSIAGEILKNYRIRSQKSESNKVKFLIQFIMSQVQAMAAKGLPPEQINMSQLIAHGSQMWMSLSPDIKEDGASAATHEANAAANTIAAAGVDNKVLSNN